MALEYIRNKHASTIELDGESILARTNIEDTFFAATIEMTVQLPDLEVISITGEIKRAFHEECQGAVPLLQEAIGLRVGPGIPKAVNSLIGGKKGCPKMADLVLECCDEVILRFTLDPLKRLQAMSEDEWEEGMKEFMQQNPRLMGSCIAFSEESPLRKKFGL
ncbi:MAG: DUF2889 domain-containing protein [Chloroflexota bacterium]|nr:DUF2889 domain-containing protein [Chloroflexota bacterium]